MFITKTQAIRNKKELLTALSINKKAVDLLNKETTTTKDFIEAQKLSKKYSFKTDDKDLVNIMFDICVELSKTFCNDNIDTKSTASFSQFNRNWTIGFLGSIFVDLLVSGKKLRVSFITKQMAKNNGYEKQFFFVESLERGDSYIWEL